jgi:hypothetical protein
MGAVLNQEIRKDWRTNEEFARDIFEGHRIEREIIDAFARYLKRMTGVSVQIEDNGIDNTGRPLQQREVTLDPDFKLNGKLVEVKFIKPMAHNFRFKASHLDSYIKQNARVLLVNGWETPLPLFTILDPEKLKTIRRIKTAVPYEPWGFKLCYFLNRDMFKWARLQK